MMLDPVRLTVSINYHRGRQAKRKWDTLSVSEGVASGDTWRDMVTSVNHSILYFNAAMEW